MPPIALAEDELQEPWGVRWLANGDAAAHAEYEDAIKKYEKKGKGKEPRLREAVEMGRFARKQGMDFGGVFDRAFAHALAEMVGGVPVMVPDNDALLPPHPNSWISGVTLGLTTALVSNRVVREAGHVLRQAQQASEHEGELLAGLRRNAGLNGKPWPAAPRVRLRAVSALDR